MMESTILQLVTVIISFYSVVYFKSAWAQESTISSIFQFQTYQVFRVESVHTGSNTPCMCTVPESPNEDQRTSWGDWSGCKGQQMSFQCHKGIQLRSRKCSKLGQIECKQREWKYCYDKGTCLGQWQNWEEAAEGGACSHSCNGGIRIKVRACLKKHEIGLFCEGNNRSPFDIKIEACNVHKCPEWSDWRISKSTCRVEKDRTNDEGSTTYVRTCSFRGKRSDGCEGLANGTTQQTVERSCNDGILSFLKQEEVQKERKSVNGDFDLNILTYILIGGLAIMLLISLCCCISFYKLKKRRQKQEESLPLDGPMEEKSHSFIGARTLSLTKPHSSGPGPKSSKYRTPENYEEVSLHNEPVHGLIQGSTRGHLPPRTPPIAPPPLHRSFQDLTDLDLSSQSHTPTYTVMAGSSKLSPVRPYNGTKVCPGMAPHTQPPQPPIPERKMTQTSRISSPSGSISVPGKERHLSDASTPKKQHQTPQQENFYLESRSNTQERREKKGTDRRKRKHKERQYKGSQTGRKEKLQESQMVQRGDSVGFSRLHAGGSKHHKEENIVGTPSHLYAEIHDNTRL